MTKQITQIDGQRIAICFLVFLAWYTFWEFGLHIATNTPFQGDRAYLNHAAWLSPAIVIVTLVMTLALLFHKSGLAFIGMFFYTALVMGVGVTAFYHAEFEPGIFFTGFSLMTVVVSALFYRAWRTSRQLGREYKASREEGWQNSP